ncbi:endonuclease NucS [Litorilinea aerophila]|uniref:DUF91 domain-containing protein n=1 Tax=Litorilinea aerophila TaxID=1204385 RepID=A0A540V890_9CHLR|nr:endonuclease NucS domain-containing protein [Litorilinea aerophila]MCC9079053.1 endonuclease NucS [Litorilinea aerophila]OUC09665.1 hypothetical protein RY27_01470 [Litorilinea aerophila]
MSTEIKTWQVIKGKLQPVATSLAEAGRKEAQDLEEWIVSNPAIIGAGIAIIGRQVPTKSGPLDLLGIDKHGNTIVIELKRDKLPRDVLAQAVDYASDVAEWSIEKLSEICTQFIGKSLEDHLVESFPDINLENLNINETQRIILVGFGIEGALERMLNWLSNAYGVNVNAVLLQYVRTAQGDELLSRVAVISEEMEQQRSQRKKFQIPMSDEPGDYSAEVLKQKLKQYLMQDLWSAKRIRRVLLPVLLRDGKATRDQLKKEFVQMGEADTERNAGYFLSLISQQVGLARNDFLRQVVGYEYHPDMLWMKETYFIYEEYRDLVREVLHELNGN